MSFILDALKRAEQNERRWKSAKIQLVEPVAESPRWNVKMVSTSRYARLSSKPGDNYAANGEGKGSGSTAAEIGASDAPGEKGPRGLGLQKEAVIAAAVLTVLLLVECALVYNVRTRMSAVAIEIGKLTRQIGETEARRAKTEQDRLSLKSENESLKQELDVLAADLEHARGNLETLKTKPKRHAARKKQPALADQGRSGPLPFAAVPPPYVSAPPPPRPEMSSQSSTTETGTSKVYSIR
jgi:hypothetical protein